MRLTLQEEQEADGRWLAEVVELPGVLAYGTTIEEARAHAQALALRVLAEQLEQGERAAQTLPLYYERTDSEAHKR